MAAYEYSVRPVSNESKQEVLIKLKDRGNEPLCSQIMHQFKFPESYSSFDLFPHQNSIAVAFFAYPPNIDSDLVNGVGNFVQEWLDERIVQFEDFCKLLEIYNKLGIKTAKG